MIYPKHIVQIIDEECLKAYPAEWDYDEQDETGKPIMVDCSCQEAKDLREAMEYGMCRMYEILNKPQ